MKKLLLALIVSLPLQMNIAHALGDHRFGLGLGAATLGNDKTYISANVEYEYRVHPVLGLGAFGLYVFSDPGFTELGLPEVFLHPFTTDLYINAAPIVTFGSGRETKWGARLGTRVPFNIGAAVFVPQVAVDFIDGNHNWFYGLAIAI